ncbi:DNA-binding transcriptional MocR family regulator [Paenibacillus taihuensis]|uniref:DNA-binding transcriptional MocR family regulator n=1 Tax=Paenibacillus taihuensis TaxID=1156355 RepID=A0A3D9S1G5_9BACL|nr:PLP-dependent aminotransferase family protein [Paenibacillus taihuensis]REE86426.1 DNA-binding transcriptional MocR family regulator [Paenibacillus taihuensis]
MKPTTSAPPTRKDGHHLFQQVYEHIMGRMERGELKTHEKLPSVRSIALDLQVHRLTAFRAYQMLKQNGKVYVKDKSGYYVSPTPSSDLKEEANSNSELPELPANQPIPAYAHLRNELFHVQQIPVTYQLAQALIDPNLLPNLFLSEHVKQVFDKYPKVMGTYGPVSGDEELREFLCGYIAKSLNIPLAANEVVITSGSQQAIDLLARVFIRAMDPILVERPTYSAALEIFRNQGARIFAVDIGPNGYDLDQVEMMLKQHKPRFFYTNPTFHNPTGYTVPASQRKRLVELAAQYRCLIIEDDAFRDMYFEEPPPRPMFVYDTDGWVVYLRSFSKYIAPGLRICAVIGRKSVIEPLLIAKSLADNGTPLLNQKIFLHYFQSERMQQHVAKLRTALQLRRDIAEQELAAASDWKWVQPAGGLNLWVKLPPALSVQGLLAESLRQSISFVPGVICDPLSERNDFIRISYCFINESQLREGIKRLVRTRV